MRGALGRLNARERYIIESRRLSEPPRTLDDIGQEYGISRERVRQIENAAYAKLQRAILTPLVAETVVGPSRGLSPNVSL